MHKRPYIDYSEAGHEKQVAGRSFTVRSILHTPTEVIVDPEDTTVYIYYKRYRVAENPSINRLAVVVKNVEVRFVLTFYGHTGRRLKGETKTKRATYLKR